MNKHSRTVPYVMTLLIIGAVIIGTTTNGPSLVALTTLSSIIVFIGTSILWIFFSRPLPWLHYGSLALLGGSFLAFAVMSAVADVLYFAWEPCRDILSKSEKALTITTQVFALYAGIGILTAGVRHVLRLSTKKLLLTCVPIFFLTLIVSITLHQQTAAKALECKSNWGMMPELQ
jgi:hypothetical protein